MRGKILFSAALLSISAAAFANGTLPPAPVAEPINYFDGFYLGLGAGMQHMDGKAKVASVDAIDLRTPQDRDQYHFYTVASGIDADVGANSFEGVGFLGYGKTFHPEGYGDGLFLGGELYVRYADTSAKATHIGGDVYISGNGLEDIVNSNAVGDFIKVKNDWSYGAVIRGGYLLTPKTMIYLLAGAEYAHFDVNVSHAVASLHYTDWGQDFSFSDHKWAFVPGVGIESMISENLSVRAQYTYASFGDVDGGKAISTKTHPVHSTSVDPGYPVTSATAAQFSPKRGEFSVALTWHGNGA